MRSVFTFNHDTMVPVKPPSHAACPLSANATITPRRTYDHNGGVLTTEDGIELVIPKDAIKEGDLVDICTATDLYGPFTFPPNCQKVQVVSPYYWIGIAAGSYHF